MRATICVMNAAFGWLTQSNSHIQCTYGQIPLHSIANGPANYAPRIQIKNDSKVKPPFVRPNIGYIARPFLVWPVCSKLLLQPVWCNIKAMIAWILSGYVAIGSVWPNILPGGLGNFFANLGGGGGFAWMIGAALGAFVHLAISFASKK